MRVLTDCNCEANAIGHTGLLLNGMLATRSSARHGTLMKTTLASSNLHIRP